MCHLPPCCLSHSITHTVFKQYESNSCISLSIRSNVHPSIHRSNPSIPPPFRLLSIPFFSPVHLPPFPPTPMTHPILSLSPSPFGSSSSIPSSLSFCILLSLSNFIYLPFLPLPLPLPPFPPPASIRGINIAEPCGAPKIKIGRMLPISPSSAPGDTSLMLSCRSAETVTYIHTYYMLEYVHQ